MAHDEDERGREGGERDFFFGLFWASSRQTHNTRQLRGSSQIFLSTSYLLCNLSSSKLPPVPRLYVL